MRGTGTGYGYGVRVRGTGTGADAGYRYGRARVHRYGRATADTATGTGGCRWVRVYGRGRRYGCLTCSCETCRVTISELSVPCTLAAIAALLTSKRGSSDSENEQIDVIRIHPFHERCLNQSVRTIVHSLIRRLTYMVGGRER